MRNFLNNLFGKNEDLPKIQKNLAPIRENVEQREGHGLYKAGDVIGGKYKVLTPLGKGGFGIVFFGV